MFSRASDYTGEKGMLEIILIEAKARITNPRQPCVLCNE